MKNKKFSFVLLLAASALTLGACNTSVPVVSGNPVDSSGAGTASSGGSDSKNSEGEAGNSGAESAGSEAGSEAGSQAVEEQVPTKVKITQQGTVAVGTRLIVADFVVFLNKAGEEITTSKYELVSKNTAIAQPTEDNKAIDILSSGRTTVGIKSSAGKALGNITIVALSAQAIQVQNFFANADSQWGASMLWQDWKGKDIADVTEQDIEENEPDWSFMAVGKNYVWDAVYGGELNSLTLAADDIEYSFIAKNGQGLDLFDDDEEVQKAVWPEDFEFTGIQSVADLVETIELTERSGYTYYSELLRSAISSAFDMTAWKEVADEETGDVHFVLNDGTKTPDFFYNIFCMDVSKMKGYSSELYFDADAEIATLVLCWNQGTGTSIQGRRCVIDFAVGEDSQLAIFDEASKNLLPPEGADVGPITDELAKFDDKAFRVDWELGYVNYEGEFEPMAVPGEDGDVYNASKGVTIADGDTIAYAYLDIDKETGEYVESEDNEYSYGGIYVDTENGGVYALEADDNFNISKPETPIKNSEEVKDINAARNALNSCDMASLTEDLIKGASLSLKEGIYNYTPKFDSLALGSVLSSFVPVYYNSSNSIPMFTDEEIASYCEGTISVDAEKDEITFILCERIRFGSSDEEEEEEESESVKARLGFKAVLSAPGAVSVDIGDNYRSVLGLDPLPAPETSEE